MQFGFKVHVPNYSAMLCKEKHKNSYEKKIWSDPHDPLILSLRISLEQTPQYFERQV